MSKIVIYGKEYNNKKGDLSWAHPFPNVSGYKRGSDITEGVHHIETVLKPPFFAT